MEIQLKCSSDILRYKESDTKFVGLVCIEGSESWAVLDAYSPEGYIDGILQRIADSQHKDENTIINDVKEFCRKDLNLPDDQVDEILCDGFEIFFVIDKENGNLIIGKNIETQSTNGGKLVSYKNRGSRFPVVFCPIESSIIRPHPPKTKTPLWSLLYDKLRRIKRGYSNKHILVGLASTIIIIIIAILIYNHPFSNQGIENPPKMIHREPLDNQLDVVDELTTKGRLIINPKEGQIIKYLINNQNTADGVKDINWTNIETSISEADTLYPKRNCQIHLFLQENGDGVYYKKLDFNFCQFIESSFIFQTNKSAIKQLFKNTWPEILTIEFDDIIEESGKEINLDAFADLLKSSHHIKKIELYQSKDTSIFSPNYPPIKTIYCRENN